MPEAGPRGAAAGPTGTGGERAGAPPGAGDADALRDALRGHRAGPELLAVLDDLADRPLPAGWRRWGEERRDRYLDEVLAEARMRRAVARRRPDACTSSLVPPDDAPAAEAVPIPARNRRSASRWAASPATKRS